MRVYALLLANFPTFGGRQDLITIKKRLAGIGPARVPFRRTHGSTLRSLWALGMVEKPVIVPFSCEVTV